MLQVISRRKLPLSLSRSFNSTSIFFQEANFTNKSKSSNSTTTASKGSKVDQKSLNSSNKDSSELEPPKKTRKTTAEIDAEAIKRMEDRFGGKDTGDMHIDENGKPASIASHVSKNFFRYI